MTTTAHLMTADDLLLVLDDGTRHELWKGEVRTIPPAGRQHGMIETAILHAMLNFVTPRSLGVVTGGDTGYLISRNPDTVLSPDVGFINAKRAGAVPQSETHWPLAPDFAVEIFSPSDSAMDVDEKIEEWLGAGVRLLWVVNPRLKAVTVHVPGHPPFVRHADEMLEGLDVLPGLQLPVAEIFR